MNLYVDPMQMSDSATSNKSAMRCFELEHKLNQAQETIQDMRKRERELTDR